jgi:hypothetical protein
MAKAFTTTPNYVALLKSEEFFFDPERVFLRTTDFLRLNSFLVDARQTSGRIFNKGTGQESSSPISDQAL